jgi:hypothetical protein
VKSKKQIVARNSIVSKCYKTLKFRLICVAFLVLNLAGCRPEGGPDSQLGGRELQIHLESRWITGDEIVDAASRFLAAHSSGFRENQATAIVAIRPEESKEFIEVSYFNGLGNVAYHVWFDRAGIVVRWTNRIAREK